MKKQLIIFLFLLSLSGCGNASISDTSRDDKVILKTIDLLSKINSYELTTIRIESTAFGGKNTESQIITEQKIIFEPFVTWSRTESTSTRIDGGHYSSLHEVYQIFNHDQLDIYMRYSPEADSSIGEEEVLSAWEKISTVEQEMTNWAIDANQNYFNAQLYLLSSNIDTFKRDDNIVIKDKNIVKYDGYLEQITILKAYQQYIREIYVKGKMLTASKNLSLEDLRNEITGGDFLEIKTGIPKLAYSEKPVPISLWIDKSTFQLIKVTVDETSVMQAYMENELPKANPDIAEPIVSRALLTYEIKSIDKLKEIPMPR